MYTLRPDMFGCSCTLLYSRPYGLYSVITVRKLAPEYEVLKCALRHWYRVYSSQTNFLRTPRGLVDKCRARAKNMIHAGRGARWQRSIVNDPSRNGRYVVRRDLASGFSCDNIDSPLQTSLAEPVWLNTCTETLLMHCDALLHFPVETAFSCYSQSDLHCKI